MRNLLIRVVQRTMKVLKLVFFLAALAHYRVSAAGSSTTPSPTTTTAKPAEVAKYVPPEGTSITADFSTGLAHTLYEENHVPDPLLGGEEMEKLINETATAVSMTALLFKEADNSKGDADRKDDDSKEKAKLLDRAARSRLRAVEKKREVALLTRKIVSASAMANETENLKKLKERVLEDRTTKLYAEKILSETSVDEIPADQLPSEIREIKGKILETAAMQIREEIMQDELKKGRMSAKKSLVLAQKKETLKIERLANGVELRTRLMKLANKQDETQIEERIKMLGVSIMIPMNES